MFQAGPFFVSDVDPGLLLYGSHDPWLVALSVAVAILAAISALHAAGVARRAHGSVPC